MLIISNQGTDPVDIVTTAGETASIGAGGHISLELGNGFTVLPHGVTRAEPVVSPTGLEPVVPPTGLEAGQPPNNLAALAEMAANPKGGEIPAPKPAATDTIAPADTSDAAVVHADPETDEAA